MTRIISSVPDILKRDVDFRLGTPPAGWDDVPKALLQLVRARHSCFQLDGKVKSKAAIAQKERLFKDWNLFIATWRCVWSVSANDRIIIWVSPGTGPINREEWLLRLGHSFCRVALRSLPESPESGKWTKLLPSNLWVLVALICCSMLERMLAHSRIRVKVAFCLFVKRVIKLCV